MYPKKIVFSPDFADALFWDENGVCIGGTQWLCISDDDDDDAISLSSIVGLEEWYRMWDKYATSKISYGHTVDKEILKKIKIQGIDLSKQIERLLPEGIEFEFAEELNNCRYLIENGRVEKLKDDE